VEHAAESLEADVTALLRRGEVVVSVGFPSDPTLERALADVAEGGSETLVVPGRGPCAAIAINLDGEGPVSLLLARREPGFAADELQLARGMARVLGVSLRMFRLAGEERRQRHEAETQSELNQRLLESLQERQELLERLARIQRDITQAAEREGVLAAICEGALELVGGDDSELTLLVPDDPSTVERVAAGGRGAITPENARVPASAGLGGMALSENRLVAMEDDGNHSSALPRFREQGAVAAMAAPLRDHGQPAGALVVGSTRAGRRFSSIERDMFLAFADHAGLALSQSRRFERLREEDAARIQGRFRSLVQSSSDMIMVIAADGSVLYASPSVGRTLGLPGAGAEGVAVAELVHPDDRSYVAEFLAAVAGRGRCSAPVEWRMRGTDGDWLDVETVATGRLDDPDVRGIVLNSRDVTGRGRLQPELR
jgi:PAS domain S-box-containing protein